MSRYCAINITLAMKRYFSENFSRGSLAWSPAFFRN